MPDRDKDKVYLIRTSPTSKYYREPDRTGREQFTLEQWGVRVHDANGRSVEEGEWAWLGQVFYARISDVQKKYGDKLVIEEE